MSAIAIEVSPDGIVIAADGVCYEYDTGNVRGFASKVITCPELSCALGWTGISDFGRAVYLEMGDAFRDFDHFTDNFAEFCQQVHRKYVRSYSLYDKPRAHSQVSVVVAGWSERRQAYVGFRVFSYPKLSHNMATNETTTNEPWTAIELPEFWCSYSPASQYLERCGLNDPELLRFGEIAPRVICAARASSGLTSDGPSEGPQVFNAGCFLQMVLVKREGIQSWISHRWPEDVIGAPIDPSKGDLLPPWLQQKDSAG